MPGDIVVNKIQALSVNEDTLDDLTIHGMVINDANTVLLTDLNSALPASVAINTKYVLVNPFGVNTPVEAVAEVQASNGEWSESPFMVYGSLTNIGGTKAGYLEGVGIVVQTGTSYVLRTSAPAYNGSTHTDTATSTVSAPCRVRVTRIGGN